jgi:hypothetical protein
VSEARVFRPSRRDNIRLLLCWILILSVDIYFTATHLHRMGPFKQFAAVGILFTALIWIKLTVTRLRGKVQT